MSIAIYKRGQGYYTRLFSALAAGLVVAMGCFRLYQKLEAMVFLDPAVKIVVQALVPLSLMAGLGFLIFWLVNRAQIADFMIAAESELRKVSWSNRKEVVTSTIVVICVMLLMSLVLLLVDIGLRFFFGWIGLIPGGGA
ncbi:MAG TPA: preprotein translocase subunit SecE [Sedimentisphaerales bacterium]|nr:preprotein translocase subunit SecE [Sedimentisphaerales bacterium]